MRWKEGIAGSMDISLSKVQEIVKDGKLGVLQSMGSQRVGHDLATKNKQQHEKTISTIISKSQVEF